MSMKEVPKIDIGAAKSKGGTMNTARTFVTAQSRTFPRPKSQSARVAKRFTSDHPVTLFLNPAITKFDTFTAVFHDFTASTCIQDTNPQLLYQFGHVLSSFKAFVPLARAYFNKAWADKRVVPNPPTSALHKTGRELVEGWIDLVSLANRSLDLGILPLFKILYEALDVVHKSFRVAFAHVQVYSIEDTAFIDGRKNLLDKIAVFRRKTLQFVFKEVPPGPNFKEDEFIGECKTITYSLSRFIIPTPPSLNMKSAEISREKTKLQYSISEVNRILDSISLFSKASRSLKVSLFQTNEVLTDLMEKMEFPFEFHIKFDTVVPQAGDAPSPAVESSTQASVGSQLGEIANMFH